MKILVSDLSSNAYRFNRRAAVVYLIDSIQGEGYYTGTVQSVLNEYDGSVAYELADFKKIDPNDPPELGIMAYAEKMNLPLDEYMYKFE